MADFVHALIMITIQSGIIFGILLLFRRLLGAKLSPVACLLLWLILFARLCIPFTVELPSVPNTPVTTQKSEHISTAAQITSLSEERIQPTVPVDGSENKEKVPQARNVVRVPWETIFFWVFIGGALISFLRLAVSCAGLRRRIQTSGAPAPESVCRLLQTICENAGVSSQPEIRLMPGTASPAVVLRKTPIILISEGFLSKHSPSSLQQALTHEVTHIRRHDHLTAAVMLGMQAFWWFNPFAHLGCRCARQDMERACDMEATRHMSVEQRAEYTRLIVRVAETAAIPALGFARGSTAKNVESRIRSVFGPRHTSVTSRIAAAGLCSVLILGCFTTAGRASAPWEPVLSAYEHGQPGRIQIPMQPEVSGSVPYVATGHWSEDITVNDRFSIHADTEILEPAGDATLLIERIASPPWPQSTLDDLMTYFTGNAPVYSALPAQWAKEDIDEEIHLLQQRLTNAHQLGDRKEEAFLQDMIAEYEAARAEAPDTAQLHAVDRNTVFADLSEDGFWRRKPEVSLSCAAVDDQGHPMLLSANSVSPHREGDMHFSFSRASFKVRSACEEIVQRAAEGGANPTRSLVVQETQAHLDTFSQATIDLSAASNRGQDILADLGIEGLSLVSCEPALWQIHPTSLARAMEGSRDTFTNLGAAMVFERRVNGVPVAAGPSKENLPGPSFGMESIHLVLDASGEILYFCWVGPSQVMEMSVPDEKILSFESIHDSLLSVLSERMQTVAPLMDWQTYVREVPIRCDVQSAELCMGYVSLPHDPRQVLAIPVWKIDTQIRYAEPLELRNPEDGASCSSVLCEEELCISALDGSLAAITEL